MTDKDNNPANKTFHISLVDNFKHGYLTSESGDEYPIPTVNTLLLDHHSVIQNPLVKEFEKEFGNLETTDFVEAEFIVRERNRKEIQELLDNGSGPGELEFFDKHKGPKAIVDKFLDYMDKTSLNRKFLTAKYTREDKYTGEDVSHNIFWEALNRYQSNRNIKPISELLEILSTFNIPSIMLTLTYDPSFRTQRESWELVSKDFNRFLTRLKIEIAKQQGIKVKDLKMPYIRVLEAQHDINGENYGYAHIHILFFGMDYLYWNGNHEEYEFIKSGHPIRKSIESFWKLGYTSVNKTASGENIRNPVNYLMKYIRKTWGSWNDEAVLTKAMLWAFNKRTFDVSRKFGEYVKSVAESSLGDNELIDIVKQYPAILDMPELTSTLNDLSDSMRTTLRNISEAYRTIRHEPVPDTAIDEFIRIAKEPAKESIIDKLEQIINGSKSDDEADDESDAENEPTCELLGMLKAFKPNRKTNPKSSRITHVVWLEERQSTNNEPSFDEVLETYDISDLDYLAEQSALFNASREQERALKFLMSAYNSGHKDWVFYVRPRVDPDPMTKLYRLGRSLARGNRKT